MEKLRNLLFYGGATPEVYRNCRDEIRKENREKLFFFLTVVIVFLLMALAVCCAVKALAGGFIAYIVALSCALALLCAVQSCQNSHVVLSICADSFLGICYLLSLYLGCFVYPEEPAVCFHVVAVVLPMLFTRPAIGNILRTVIYEALFIGGSVTFKDPAVVPMDVLNAVLFGLLGCVIISVPMFVLSMIVSGAFGGGDIKLTFAWGFFLGWKLSVFAFFLAVLIGGGYAVYLLAAGKKERKEHFAFGPFLCIGAMIATLWGETLIQWYLGLF